MNNRATKFGVKIDKVWDGCWSFGICLSHMNDETYIFINLFKWTISIGKLYEDCEFEYDADEWEWVKKDGLEN